MTEDQASNNQSTIFPLAMHDNYGPFFRSFFARYFNPIQFPQDAIERIKELEQKGTVVYLAPYANSIHFLYLNYICIKHGLPLARFVNAIDPVLLQPVNLLIERVRVLGDDSDKVIEENSDQLTSVIKSDNASLLFLDKPSTITSPGHDNTEGLLKTLIDIQRSQDRPIFLIPHLMIWHRRPETITSSLADVVFGQPESPGLFRSLVFLLRFYRKALVKVADPINLAEFIRSRPDQSISKLIRSIQDELAGHLQLETFDVTGPTIRPPTEFKQDILDDKLIKDYIEKESNKDQTKKERIQKKAHDLLDEIAAEPRSRWPRALDFLLNIFWRKMYEGLVVDEEGFERIRAAIRKSPIVFCPCHKSHVDYLVMSQLCIKYAVPLPHIAAGINLSFWPMGPIFRHSGAFFLRRSFKGDRFYPIIFRTYLRYVMKEGFPVEFFIEGTRSRTGKLLNPRFGILSWIIQAFLEGTGNDIQFVPISIDYEKIVESRAYIRELSGGEKNKEDISGLLKSRKALKSKHGKVYIQIGEPISLANHIEERGFEGRGISEKDRRALTQEISHKILFGINRVSTVTPSAILAFSLLSHRRRGISQERLFTRAKWVADWVKRRGHTRFSATLEDFERSLVKAASRFSRDGLIKIRDTGYELVYSAVEHRRLALDYYRNNIIHHFVPASICVLALESFDDIAINPADLSERIRFLSRLFKFEFLFRSTKHFEKTVRKALDDLKAENVVSEDNGQILKVEEAEEKRKLFYSILEHFVESYWLLAKHLVFLLKDKPHEKEFLSRTLQMGDRLFAHGELMLNESLNRVVLKNALKYFEGEKVVQSIPTEDRKGPKLELLPPYDNEEELTKLADQIRTFLKSA
jgi:glycerol-3-phosphate O-acyltransferase